MKKITFSIAIFLAAISPAFAQDHAHGAPHGGTVKTAGNYHLEAVVKNNVFTVYLLDANEKEMSVKGSTISATLLDAAGKTSVVKMIPGTNSFTYTAGAGKKYKKAILSAKINGTTASATFDLQQKPAAAKKQAHGADGHKH